MLRNSTIRLYRWQPSAQVIQRCFCQDGKPPSDGPKDDQPQIASETVKTVKKSEQKISQTEAKTKLTDLLTSFSKTPKPTTQLKVLPKVTKIKGERKKKVSVDERKLDDAVRDVAESLGGEEEKTKQELKEMVKSHETEGYPVVRVEKVKKPVDEEALQKSKKNLSETLMGMKVDKAVVKPEETEFQQPRRRYDDDQQQQDGYGRARYGTSRDDDTTPRSRLQEFRTPSDRSRMPQTTKYVKFEEAEPLDIYPKDYEIDMTKSSQLETWNMCAERELRLAATHFPRNAFEEMIRWTEKGMLWKFPIDNEYGLEYEKSCTFADHIFLERHLEGWCPPKGPVRHFMELVCVGLSKNPYITVERKKRHIEWYKDYFESKESVLKEIGAI